MKIADIRRRVDRVKGRMAPPARRYPVNVSVEAGETSEQAIARHTREHGRIPFGLGLLVTPAPGGDDWTDRFREQQRRLVDDGRRSNAAAPARQEPVPALPVGTVKLPRFIVKSQWKAS